ncbi:hypothetical protein AR158_C478R [Paramecium bursaria Chlorella virus AR158]|uniref:hypothetical protein n=1 Tax=Paramecium bursaria Chlorella virus AR158 TaxID=380598 RepID=UPI00015AA6FD|nr:hypothetical protein AR158_C478R [Paramecium bursaria Chlorella virus AR158]ABU44023.1 hypothetical protein AR158_C478R [Paramecium bursaria Chlorella virus AR158]
MINAIKRPITPTFLRENPVPAPTSLLYIPPMNEVFTTVPAVFAKLFPKFETLSPKLFPKLFPKFSTLFPRFSPNELALFPMLFKISLKNSLFGILPVIY